MSISGFEISLLPRSTSYVLPQKHLIYNPFTAKRPKVRYVFVPNYLRDWVFLRNMPARILDRLLACMLKLQRLQK